MNRFHRKFVPSALITCAIWFAGCSNHYLIHPKSVPPEVETWSSEAVHGALKLRLEWAKPAAPPDGEDRYPAVLVHPEARHTAKEMRGILRSLSEHGFLAVAIDYEHIASGERVFTWYEKQDAQGALAELRARPEVDDQRIGAIGYSQGGVYSLLIAAETQAIDAVVAYYPVTDFGLWLDDPDRPFVRRQLFRLVRWATKRSADRVRKDRDDAVLFERASPLAQVDRIDAPVLLIHGDRDTTVTLKHSLLLAEALEEREQTVELVVVPGAGHVFNFEDREDAKHAWARTLDWLDHHLKTD